MSVQGKMIVLGVSGGIAAYKACTICSRLAQKGADVRVIMTESARRFVSPLTFQSLSRKPVYYDTFDEEDPSVISHIDLADHADLFLLAPATANIVGKMANGIADDMLSTTLLATTSPVWVAPSMNGHMYAHPAVEINMQRLRERGVHFLEPGEGQLACGYVGKGRLAEPEEIVEVVEKFFTILGSGKYEADSSSHFEKRHSSGELDWLNGKRVLVTAGPTQEAIDPVRYVSNHSSGKMGYAIAGQAARYGADVVLVTGPTALSEPESVHVIRITTTEDMYTEVLNRYDAVDVVIKAAAVADYTPVRVEQKKLKKSSAELVLKLRKTKDILRTLGERKKEQILVGFAAETDQVEQYARRKLRDKNLDFIVANDVTEEGAGFGTDTNVVHIFSRNGDKQSFPVLPKEEVAEHILRKVSEFAKEHSSGQPNEQPSERMIEVEGAPKQDEQSTGSSDDYTRETVTDRNGQHG